MRTFLPIWAVSPHYNIASTALITTVITNLAIADGPQQKNKQAIGARKAKGLQLQFHKFPIGQFGFPYWELSLLIWECNEDRPRLISSYRLPPWYSLR